MLTFSCPHCGRNLEAADDSAGRNVRCPHCAHLVPVPSVTVALAAPPTAVPSRLAGDNRTEQHTAVTDAPAGVDTSTSGETILAPTLTPSSGAPERLTFELREEAPVPPARPPSDATILTPSGAGTETNGPYRFLTPPQQPDELGRLGPYRILEVLGAGGMGVVFRAEDPALKRLVALKVMLPGVASTPTARQRFLREARAAAAIEHDHVITIYQVGEDRGVPFLAMQLLRGEPLEDRLRREHQLPPAEILRIGREIAEGLAAAHDRNLIHRDVKPANVWLEGVRGRVKLLDFGLARVADDSSRLTQTGAILGTPAYMAPEQAQGQPLDGRCDLFSLGCILYRISAGEPPFQGPNAMAILFALVSQDPKPLAQVNPQVSPALAELVHRLLARDPRQRPLSAHSVVQTLQEMERGQPVAPRALLPAPAPAPGILDIDDSALRLAPAPGLADEPDLPAPVPVDEAPAAETPAAPPASGTSLAALPAERLHELSGRTLGSHEIGPVLGRGDCGVVFRAQDRKGRTVALRVLPPEFPHDAAEMQRFVRASKQLLGLSHPNVPGLYGAGKSGPYCWVALEHVPGEGLDRVLERLGGTRKKGDWRRAFRVAVHVGRALDFAAQHHLVHGAIAPPDVLWAEEERRARLSGLLRQTALEGSVLERRTRERRRREGLPYLAPEQLDGNDRGDELSDLYSLGAVVYHGLAGRPPFTGETPRETAEKIQKGGPAKPSQFVRGIPAELEWVVLTMLSKDRKYRFQTASELLVHLDRIGLEHGVAV